MWPQLREQILREMEASGEEDRSDGRDSRGAWEVSAGDASGGASAAGAAAGAAGGNVQVAEFRDLPADEAAGGAPVTPASATGAAPAAPLSKPWKRAAGGSKSGGGGSRVLTKGELREIAARQGVDFEKLLADATAKGIELADE